MENGKVFERPVQIGLIVKNLDQALADFKELLDMEQWRIADFPPEGEESVMREYHGGEEDFTAKFCFYDWGNIELEIIQPLSGKSVWFDFLDKTPAGIGLHHIKFMVDRHGPVEKHFTEKGIPAVTRGEGVGPNAGRIWTFYDTSGRLGFDVEIINRIRTAKNKSAMKNDQPG